jgi:pimeloyl-ACP methyl ester carboxylesterase
MNRLTVRLPILISIIVLSSSPTQPQERKPGDLRIEPSVFKAANGETVEAESGVLVVLENRSRPGSRLIELAFMRLKSRNSKPGVPILYLVGGPGGQAIAQVRMFFPQYSNLLEAGDLILLDQRGTGTSNPNLNCIEKLNYPLDKPLEREELLRMIKEASLACARAWREKGVDLEAYNTLENAADVEALREALKIDRLNLFGTSYGTHLALAVIRRYGAHLNRVILAGIEGPDHTYKLPSQIDQNFAEIAALVKADSKIGNDMPDLLGVIRAIASRLEKEPAAVELPDPATQRKVKIVVGRFDFQLFLAIFPGRVARIKMLPATLDRMMQGDFTALAQFSLAARREPTGSAMSFMMDCSSSASAERWERIKREEKDSLAGAVIDFPFPDVCEAWNAPDLGSAFRSPVESSVPILFISGGLDGRTPASNAEEVRRGFPNSHHLIVENAGHVDATMFTTKTKEVMVDFLLGKPVTIDKIPAPPLEFMPLKKNENPMKRIQRPERIGVERPEG